MSTKILKYKKIILTVIGFTVLIVCFFIVYQYQITSFSNKIEYFISCKPYEESFLQSMGFKDKNDCIQFNKELEDEYKNSCIEVINKTSNTDFNKTSLEACIYHSFAKARTSFDSNYYIFKHSK